MTEILQALHQLHDAVAVASADDDAWRWHARQELSRVREVLATVPVAGGAHVAARSLTTRTERKALLAQIGALGPRITSSEEVGAVVQEVHRLVRDLIHHVQRVNDLAWDSVEMELGGSE